MGLEVGTYISDLVATNPVHASDDVSVGDDHIRLLKSTILATFPSITGAVSSTHTELNYLDGVTGVTGSGNLALSASPTFTGTLMASAIAATTYDGVAAANLLDKSATETVSGAYTFSATLTVAQQITLATAGSNNIRNSSDAADNTILAGTTFDSATNSYLRVFGPSHATANEIHISTPAAGIARVGRGGVNQITEFEVNAALVDLNTTTLSVNGTTLLGINNAVSNPLRLVAKDSVGDCYLSFYEDTATTRKGYVGFSLTVDDAFYVHNEIDGAGLRLIADDGDFEVSVDDNGSVCFQLSATTGLLTTPNSDASEVGFKGMPQNAQNGNYTLVLTDAGKTIYKASGGAGETITIPANASVAFPVGTVIEVINQGGGDLSLAITTDTLTWLGVGSTGTRTIGDDGSAVIRKVTSTAWVVSGVNLS